MKRTKAELRGAIATVSMMAADRADAFCVCVLSGKEPAEDGATFATNLGSDHDFAIAMLEVAIEQIKKVRDDERSRANERMQ